MKYHEMSLSKEAYIFGAIFSLANRMQTLGDRIDPAVSIKQWFVLAVVAMYDKAVPNIGDVARILGSSRQNIKKMAVILEKKGYLNLQSDKNDMRKIQLLLTDSCYDYFNSRKELENEYEKRMFYGVDEQMIDSLCDGVRKLTENIDKLINSDSDIEGK